jgi:hypothetical protein
MDENACRQCGARLWANGSCACGWHRGKALERKAQPRTGLPLSSKKRCRLCSEVKPPGFFPRDRSRSDGRWHTCALCNKKSWHGNRHQRQLQRIHTWIQRRENSRTGIRGLRKHYRAGSQFDYLPVALRLKAEAIWSKSIARARAEGKHLSQAEIALRKANAVSNCVRVGDRSWSRSMLRHKGYRRAERRGKF